MITKSNLPYGDGGFYFSLLEYKWIKKLSLGALVASLSELDVFAPAGRTVSG